MPRVLCLVNVAFKRFNGNDVMALGYKGREIGIVLNTVLEKVIDGELQNNKETIIGFLTDFKL